MPRSSDIVRSLAAVGLGIVAFPAFGQSANVTAFNPYDGAGTSRGAAPAQVYAIPQGAPDGMAFNPWNPAGTVASGVYVDRRDVQATTQVSFAAGGSNRDAYAPGSSGSGAYSGSYLPAPPPGPIESRLTAIPQRADRAAVVVSRPAVEAPAPPPVVEPAMAPAIAPPPAASVPPAPVSPTPIPVVVATPNSIPPPAVIVAPAPAPASPPAVVVAPTPAPAPPPVVASVAPPKPPAAATPIIASVAFLPQSAEISTVARVELDRVAQTVKGGRGIELRAYASGSDAAEARKIALARALSVRSYLIDQNMKTRIEVGAFASTDGGGERVDVLAP